jgi:hypothetical protein
MCDAERFENVPEVQRCEMRRGYIGTYVDPCQLHPFQALKLRKQRVLIRAFEIMDGVVCPS